MTQDEKKHELRKALADFFTNPAVLAMWRGHIKRKGLSAEDAEEVVGWLRLWAKGGSK